MDPASGGASSELLEPVNLKLRVSRNLAASWYNKMAAVEVDGDLKPMKVGTPLREYPWGGGGPFFIPSALNGFVSCVGCPRI